MNIKTTLIAYLVAITTACVAEPESLPADYQPSDAAEVSDVSIQLAADNKTKQDSELNQVAVLSFNILQGGGNAGNVGFPDSRFGGSRFDDLANIIVATKADIVGVQEDANNNSLLTALGPDWNRQGNIYSKLKLEPLGPKGGMLRACRVLLPSGDTLVFVNCHWWPTGGYGPGMVFKRIVSDSIPEDLNVFEKEILEATKEIANGPRGYKATVNLVQPFLKADEKVILVGDFNEPSHLDWTERYAKEGKDRLVKNPTQTPMRFKIEWPGSKALKDIGLSDAYRTVHADEVTHPGITWTPPYADGTPGRANYSNQQLDRIDRIYFNDSQLISESASTVTGREGNGEIKLDCDWPSDHWAVLATFEIKGN